MRKYLIIALVAASLLAQAPVKVVDGTFTEIPMGAAGKKFNSGMQLMTNSATTVTNADSYVQVLFCANIAGATRTLTVTDGQGSPMKYFDTVSMAANSSLLLYASQVGLYFEDGVKITASANSSINCIVQGVQ